jgi:hypothetical protein
MLSPPVTCLPRNVSFRQGCVTPTWDNSFEAISVNWVSVDSTVFTSAAYDESAWQLYLRFHSGKVYRYFNYPPYQYDEFVAAESKGGYFGSHIRGKFRDEEVRETRLHRELTYSS